MAKRETKQDAKQGKSRGGAVRVLGLPPSVRVKFQRAVQLTGRGTQSQFLANAIRQIIREAEAAHGNLLAVLTPDEAEIVRVIRDGAAEFSQIVEETMIAAGRAEKLLTELVDRGVLEVRKKGGKTEQARGAATKMYFVADGFDKIIAPN